MVRLTTSKRMELQKKFAAVDKSGDRKLDLSEMKILLLEGNPDLEDGQLKKLFKRVDKDNNGSVDFDEFIGYLYNAPQSYQAAPEACIEKFKEFAGPEMDGTEFSKFCKDCGLIDKGNFKREEIATTFAKVLPRGKRKITLDVGPEGFSQYDKLLSLLADKKRVSPSELFRMVAGGEKVINATKADAVRFHDDKSLYTGAHSQNENHGDCSSPKHARDKFDIGEDDDWSGCETTYAAFDKDNDGLTNRDFTKLCSDSGIVAGTFSTNDADIIFATLRHKKLDFEAFKEALRIVAERKQDPISAVQAVVARCTGPVVTGTTPDAVRFHDDKDAYTGTHAGK